MKKQNLIVIVLFGMGAAVLMYHLMTSRKGEQPPVPSPTSASAPSEATTNAGKSSSDWQIRPGQKPGCTIGSLDPNTGYKLQVELQSEGAAARTIRLSEEFETVADKQLFEKLGRNEAEYADKIAAEPEKYRGHYAVFSPVRYHDAEYVSLMTGSVKLTMEGPSGPEEVVFHEPAHKRWRLVDVLPTTKGESAVFEWPIYRRLSKPGRPVRREKVLTIRKTYTVTEGDYSVDVKLEAINHIGQPVRLQIDQAGPTGIEREDPRVDDRMAIVARVKDGKIQPQHFDAKKLSQSPYGEEQIVGRSNAPQDPVVWLSSANKYFAAVLYLEPIDADSLNAASYDAEYYLKPVQQTDQDRAWVTGVHMREVDLLPAGEKRSEWSARFNLFAGPKLRRLFDDNPLYARLRYVETITVSGCSWCTFTWLMVGLMWLLGFFSQFLFGNYGLAIILLVVIVRVLLHPLTKKSQVSMSRMGKVMAELRPQLEKIKEKYADDKATQQREMLRLQKQAGLGPGQILGCLPMLLQMPIWVALYSGLSSEVALRHAAFLPVWITDLAAPDRLFSFGYNVPLVGSYFNLLPLLVTVAMYLSTKFNPATAAQNISPDQASQQKMMKIMMPGMMLVFFYQAPSGLNLYVMASTFAGVVEQYYIRKHIEQRDRERASQETVVKVSGKGPRSSRPKKPRGPFWIKRS